MLSREPHKSQKTGLTSYGWILGQDRKPMYAVQSEEKVPPKSGWKKFSGQAPIPAVEASTESLKTAAETVALAFKDQGNALFASRAYREAASRWSRALSTLEKYCSDSQVRATLYANRAESHLRLESWAEALLDSEAALAQKPTHDKALLRAATALRGLKRYGDAMGMVQRCLDQDPQHYDATVMLQDLDRLVAGEQSVGRTVASRPSGRARGGDDLSDVPRYDAQDVNHQKGLEAFEGYSEMRENSNGHVPISELPYHKMGLPQEQLDLMDNFFRELRASKKQQAKSKRQELAEYELVKNEYRERALEDQAAMGRPAMLESPVPALPEEEELPLTLMAPKKPPSEVETRISSEEKKEIDDLFANFKPKTSKKPGGRLQQVIYEEEEEAKVAEIRAMEELKKLQNSRRGEPTRFEQAAGELYCWWSLPPGIQAKDIKVSGSGGERLMVSVRGVRIFDRQLFHQIKGDDIIWSLDAGELSLTLTKRERSKLWDQLGSVGEIQRDAAGNVVPSSIPEPMSMHDRLDKFRQMVTGDDGEQPRYEDLNDKSKQLVDAMRRFEHARATGDQNALSLAEHDLEELGRVVV
eukprot:Skav225947  [mRNA]  locus=scaffold1500:586407:588745:- [translate_table: standard]